MCMSDNFPLKRYHKTFDHVSHFLFVPLPVFQFPFLWKLRTTFIITIKILYWIRFAEVVEIDPNDPKYITSSSSLHTRIACVFVVSIPNVGGSCVCCVSICIVLLFPGDTTCNHHHQLLPTALSPRSHNRHTLWHTYSLSGPCVAKVILSSLPGLLLCNQYTLFYLFYFKAQAILFSFVGILTWIHLCILMFLTYKRNSVGCFEDVQHKVESKL